MARQHGQGTLTRVPDVKGADLAIDARGRDEGGAVFVPVVGQGFGGGGCLDLGDVLRGCWVGVKGDGAGEVVGGGGRGAEVEDAEVGVGGDGAEDGGRVRGEGSGVGAGMGGEGEEGVGALGGPLGVFVVRFFWPHMG